MSHMQKLNGQRARFLWSDATDWQKRHGQVMLRKVNPNPIAMMVMALARYADDHRERYESSIGDDGVLGPEWAAAVRATLGLLNGELGGLDAGTIDKFLREMLAAEGFTEE